MTQTPHIHQKRACVVGTAPNWRQAPWDDPTLKFAALNDAYMNKLPRADMWWEQHPLSHFFYRHPDQKLVYSHQVPYGYYVRPQGHIEWLQQQSRSIPVFLQQEPPPGFGPHAQRFPIEDVDAYLGRWETPYKASGPQYMVEYLMMKGFTEIQVFGINLATEHEYREQRSAWEFTLARFLGRHITMRREGNVRIYEGSGEGTPTKLVLPNDCPILTHDWVYAYQPKPMEHPLKTKLKVLQQQRGQVMQQMATASRWVSRKPFQDRLVRLAAQEEDLTLRLHQQAMAGGTVAVAVR